MARGKSRSERRKESSEQIREQIRLHADEINRLRAQTVAYCAPVRGRKRLSQDELREVWLTYDRCYDALAFPGGWEGATCRLLAGDPECMEAAICFLEVRPYFYHSGYMFNSLLRKAKRAPLDPEQLERLGRVLDKLAQWKLARLRKQARD
ncbi:hypothetical protein [Serratia liquefaciens]|uniref:hypothetical protein n=1 Tax=Serratia liquefaciens TaxID=614 RepID=UPI0038517224